MKPPVLARKRSRADGKRPLWIPLAIAATLALISVFVLLIKADTPVFYHFYYVPVGLAAWFYGGATTLAIAAIAVLVAIVNAYVYVVNEPSVITSGKLGDFLLVLLFECGFLLALALATSLFLDTYRKDREKLRRMSLVDRLTGLRNYGYFMDRLVEERRRADREDSELSLLMADLDNFKIYNDLYGHAKGNIVLQKVADTLRSCMRGHDVVCRFGGEEFAIILPRTTTEEAEEIAERIRKEVGKLVFEGERKDDHVKMTISCGIPLPTRACAA